jgi:carbonic anhydrase
MKKLVRGIVDFQKHMTPEFRQKFQAVALEQRPDVLFISCSDSRVAPNWFASTEPGDLFVQRNVGNLVPPCGKSGHSVADEAEVAAIEFALLVLKVTDIIVCGHSDCGAIRALMQDNIDEKMPHLKSWLRHGKATFRLEKTEALPESRHLPRQNRLSQLNVLQQLEHLTTYPIVQAALEENQVRLHGWWFDIGNADIYNYDVDKDAFIKIEASTADKILKRLV